MTTLSKEQLCVMFLKALLTDFLSRNDFYRLDLSNGKEMMIYRNWCTKYAGYPAGSCFEVTFAENNQCSQTEIFDTSKEGEGKAIQCFITRILSDDPSKASGTGMTYDEVFKE